MCRVCSVELGPPIEVKEMMYGTGEVFTYQQCTSCGSLWLANPPDDYGPYYQDDYYSLDAVGSRVSGWDVYRYAKGRAYHLATAMGVPWPASLSRPTYARFGDPAGLKPSARVLDVGCGSGQLLRELRRSGFQHLTGFDPFLNESSTAGGVRLVQGDWADIDGEFDIIMMHHSLEHVEDPLATLRIARSRLSAAGRIVVRIPIVAEAWRRYRENWVQIDAPRHTVVFSIDGIEKAAKLVGLDLVTAYCDSTSFQFWGSEQYCLGMGLHDRGSVSRGIDQSPFSRQEIAAWEVEASLLNAEMQGDQAAFVFAASKG